MICLVCLGQEGVVQYPDTAEPLRTKGFHTACLERLKAAIRAASVITCADRNSSEQRILHGAPLLRRSPQQEQENPLRILQILVDFDGDDIDQVAAVCASVGKDVSMDASALPL